VKPRELGNQLTGDKSLIFNALLDCALGSDGNIPRALHPQQGSMFQIPRQRVQYDRMSRRAGDSTSQINTLLFKRDVALDELLYSTLQRVILAFEPYAAFAAVYVAQHRPVRVDF